ncbi:MAG: adenylate/guanylate cyclase domain-containing protein [Desulfobacteraceae bacterium]|nr:adenylate/guanylate cyclase domain-containing protein [Desulfobacteraceae bacterium]
MSRKIKIQRSIPALAGIFVMFFSVIFYFFYGSSDNSIFRSFDFEITNLFFKMRGEKTPSDKIVIIDIDEKSLNEIGQWPWPRNTIAELIIKINAKKPKITGLDMFFPEPDRTSPDRIFKKMKIKGIDSQKLDDHDKILGNVIGSFPVVMGYIFDFKNNMEKKCCPFSSAAIKINSDNVKFRDLYLNEAENVLLNINELSTSLSEGFINILPESSGLVRKAPLLIKYNNIPCPSFALEIFRIYSQSSSITILPSSQKKDKKNALLGIYSENNFIKTDIDGQMFINFKGRPFTYKYISAADILNEKKNFDLESRIVLVGTSAAGLLDLKATPFSGACPGVEIHATIIDNMLNNDFMHFDKFTETGISYFILVPVSILISFILVISGPIAAGLITTLSICGIFLTNYFLLFKNNIITGFSFPVLSIAVLCMTIIVFNYFFREREKKFIQKAFSHYVSPEIVNELIKNPEKLSLSGETKTISIMFGDIRDFTAISEKLKPHELGELLNIYFSKISEIIRNNNGVVDKFIGDAVMAFWGAPLENKTHAKDSVLSAIKILSEIENLNIAWRKKNFPVIRLGMGINTGEVRIGNFGSIDRFDYTVIGDNVNLASRVEGLNKFYSTNLLITEFTENLVKNDLLSRKTDWVRVKGKTQPVEIYEPLCFFPCDPKIEDETNIFHSALDHYKAGNFSKAENIILELKHEKNLNIYEIYLKRIEKLKNTELLFWDGVFEFQTK